MKASPKLCVMVFDRTVKDFFIAHFDILRGTEILSWKTKSGLLPRFDLAKALYANLRA